MSVIFLLMAFGGCGALAGVCIWNICQGKFGKIAAAVILIAGILAGYVLQGMLWGCLYCEHCGRMQINHSEESAMGITTVKVCRHCVEYISCEKSLHITQPPPLPQICTSCQEDPYIIYDPFNDKVFDFMFYTWLSGYLVGGGIFLALFRYFRKRKQSADGAIAEKAAPEGA